MLRSRGERPGRFHKSPKTRSCAYWSSAGATIRTSLRISTECAPGFDFVGLLCADAAQMRQSDASVPARTFICMPFHLQAAVTLHLPYCSSPIFSIQSTFVPSSDSVIARCVMPLVAVAPCQCLTPGGVHITSPDL